MPAPDKHKKPVIEAAGGTGARPGEPDWAPGLKRLYDAVVEEPLPEAFHDLLARLDEIPKK